MAEARTLARSERGPLEGTGWVHHCQEAAQDWDRLRESDPGQALGILLGTRDATERWLGDAEPASQHLSRSLQLTQSSGLRRLLTRGMELRGLIAFFQILRGICVSMNAWTVV